MAWFWKRKKSISDRLAAGGGVVMLGDSVDAGVVVTREMAIEIATVFACQSILAESVGMIPVKVFKRENNKRVDAGWTREGKLMRFGPNAYQTTQDWLVQIMWHCLGFGDHFSKITRVNGYADQIFPYENPEEFAIKIEHGKKKFIRKFKENEKTRTQVLTSDEVFHIPAGSPDGYSGRDFLHTHRQTLSLARAIGKYGCKFFANGGNPRGILIVPGLSRTKEKSVDEQIETVKKSFHKSYGGSNWHDIGVFQSGVEFKPLSVDPDKTQALETRQQVNKEIAAIYNVPLWKLEQTKAPTLAERNSFYTDTLGSWIMRIESQINKQLFLNTPFYCKFNTSALLRADQKSRYQAYAIGLQFRFLCPNEVRAFEELEPYEGGEKFINPNVMSKLDTQLLEEESKTDEAKTKQE